ncbi:hypothetical protein FO519_009482 [Halicephalobus sp. NKZ332]|nr:hypothetical protein FO519_009482 [Halicephalobus sp. NKZ332]
MMLNSDLYEDLAAELILSEEGRQKFMTEFMLSGKGLLSALRRVTKKMKCVCFFWEECHSNPSCSPYLVTLKLDDREGISMDLDHPDMLKIIHWTLSSVRRVRINCDKPLPGNVVELLLNNPNFTELELNLYDFPTAKLLIESRRFEFIEVDFGMSDDLNRIRIDTEKLEFHNASLRDILRMQSINVTSLCATYSYEGFDDSILTMNLRLVSLFQIYLISILQPWL